MKGGDSVFLNDDEAVVNISFPNPWLTVEVLMANSSTTSMQRLATTGLTGLPIAPP